VEQVLRGILFCPTLTLRRMLHITRSMRRMLHITRSRASDRSILPRSGGLYITRLQELAHLGPGSGVIQETLFFTLPSLAILALRCRMAGSCLVASSTRMSGIGRVKIILLALERSHQVRTNPTGTYPSSEASSGFNPTAWRGLLPKERLPTLFFKVV